MGILKDYIEKKRTEKEIEDLVFIYENCNILNADAIRERLKPISFVRLLSFFLDKKVILRQNGEVARFLYIS